jgi:hypothetical protein
VAAPPGGRYCSLFAGAIDIFFDQAHLRQFDLVILDD